MDRNTKVWSSCLESVCHDNHINIGSLPHYIISPQNNAPALDIPVPVFPVEDPSARVMHTVRISYNKNAERNRKVPYPPVEAPHARMSAEHKAAAGAPKCSVKSIEELEQMVSSLYFLRLATLI